MAEYIEREKLEEAFDDVKPDVCESDFNGYCKWGFGRKNIRDVIRGVPIADVAPVVHGRWIETDRFIRDGKSKVYGWECTVCKRFTRSPFVDSWNYCPNCGARMDGDEQ